MTPSPDNYYPAVTTIPLYIHHISGGVFIAEHGHTLTKPRRINTDGSNWLIRNCTHGLCDYFEGDRT